MTVAINFHRMTSELLNPTSESEVLDSVRDHFEER